MPLIYRDKGTSGTQIDVLSNNLRIAHISKNALRPTRKGERWHWNFTTTVGPVGFQFHGDAETLDAAVVAIERNWQLWLTVAGPYEKKVSG